MEEIVVLALRTLPLQDVKRALVNVKRCIAYLAPFEARAIFDLICLEARHRQIQVCP